MAYQAKYVSSTALAYSAVRRQAVRVLNYTSKLVTGIEPATFGPAVRRSNHYEVFLSYGTHFVFFTIRWDATIARRLLESSNGGNQNQRVLHLSRLRVEVTPYYGNLHLFFSKLLKELFCFRDAKLCFGQRNLSA